MAGYEVREATNPSDAISSKCCDVGLLDAAGPGENLERVARHLLATSRVAGILFFDGSRIAPALEDLRGILRDVRATVERVRTPR
jgi:hypothetical protein